MHFGNTFPLVSDLTVRQHYPPWVWSIEHSFEVNSMFPLSIYFRQSLFVVMTPL